MPCKLAFFVVLCAVGALSLLQSTAFKPDIFFDDDLEAAAFRPAFSESDREAFAAKLRSLRVESLEEGCGRLKNRLARLSDGTKVCCRYRDSAVEVRSDLYAFHFARLLGMEGFVPPASAVRIDFADPQWSDVVAQCAKAGWRQGTAVGLTAFVDDLSEVYVPVPLREEGVLLTRKLVQTFSRDERLRLMQWSDMITFDYVTGHTDRLFNTMLNLQWTPGMLLKPVHNLAATGDGQLVLLDNESAFWLGYTAARMNSSLYGLQAWFLNRTCVFRKHTVETVVALATSDQPWTAIEQFLSKANPRAYAAVGPLPANDGVEMASRLRSVVERYRWCSEQMSH